MTEHQLSTLVVIIAVLFSIALVAAKLASLLAPLSVALS